MTSSGLAPALVARRLALSGGSRDQPGAAVVRRLGVRGQLMLAFSGISALVVVAAVAGMHSLERVGEALGRITEERVPSALASLELSRQAERIVAAAPALLAVGDPGRQREVSAAVTGEAQLLNRLLEELRNSGIATTALEPLVDGLGDNLAQLDRLVTKRLQLRARKTALLQRLGQTMIGAQRLISPGIVVMDSKLAQWERETRQATADNEPQALVGFPLAREILSLLPQQRAQIELSTLNDTLLRTATAEAQEDLSLLVRPLDRSLAKFAALMPGLDPKLQPRLQQRINELRTLVNGPESIPQARADELRTVVDAERLLGENADLSRRLTEAVDRLIAGTKEDTRRARGDALAVQRFSSGLLIGVASLSLISSLLIVWLYVGGNLIRRLRALSSSMLAIAGGNLGVPLPAAGSDEIGRMAEALAVFRDTAVEVEENKLREIAQARQRLVDAIESISEGFAFYDADDRLVLCNTQYRNLLHPSDAAALQPGTPFEAIIRDAVGKGLIVEAEADPEAYIRERLEYHRNPGPPQLQRRRDGRWLLISERRIAGGGTVAVYSDLTELKEKEQRVASANRQVLDSLQYASRIQSAVLPPRDALVAVAADHFLLWQPRDIVGGDFFWLRHVQGGDLIMLGDCTGHGVPGAFMTLIVTGLLDRVARDLPGESPGRLLSGLHRELQRLLGQHRSTGETDDGLEAGLCFLSRAERRVVFAGARFSLWRARGGAAEEIKGGGVGVGFRRVPADTVFGDLTLDLAEGDKLYLTTDGLTDQIGGDRRRSFGKGRLARFIADHHEGPMAEQGVALSRLFAQYQGREARRDDVTVLGLDPLGT